MLNVCPLFFLFLRVRALLSTAQNLNSGDEHPLPWYPPICIPLLEINDGNTATYDHIRSVADRASFAFKSPEPSMRRVIKFILSIYKNFVQFLYFL